MLPLQITTQYEIGDLIARGAFSAVYEGVSKSTKKPVAIKLVPLGESSNTEATLLAAKPQGLHIPKLVSHERFGDQIVTVQELLGRSVYSLMQIQREPVGLEVGLRIAYQAGKVLKWLHRKGYIHRDVKPDNILFGRGKRSTCVYLIDFSEATKYRSRNSASRDLVGNPYFLSLNVLKGGAEGPKDDLESLLISVVYTIRGSLPWMNITEMDQARLQRLVIQKKEANPPEKLCEGLPSQLLEALQYARSLKERDMPDYDRVFGLFESAASTGNVNLKQTSLDSYTKKMSTASESTTVKTGEKQGDDTHRSTSDPHSHLRKKRDRTAMSVGGEMGAGWVNPEKIPTVVSKRGPAFSAAMRQKLMLRRQKSR